MTRVASTRSSPIINDLQYQESGAYLSSTKRKHYGSGDLKTTPKRKKAAKARNAENDALNMEVGINTALGKFDSHLLADYVAQQTKRWAPDLSLVEMEDKYIPGRYECRFWSWLAGPTDGAKFSYRKSFRRH